MDPKRAFTAGLREIGASSKRTGEIELVHSCMNIDAKEVARSMERPECRSATQSPREDITEAALACVEEPLHVQDPREPSAGAGRAMDLRQTQRSEREIRAEHEDLTFFVRMDLKLKILNVLSDQYVYNSTRMYAFDTLQSMETATLEDFAVAMQLQHEPADTHIDIDPVVLKRNAVVRVLIGRGQLLDPHGEGHSAIARVKLIIRRAMLAFGVEVQDGDMELSEGVQPAAKELSVFVVDCCKAQGLKIEAIRAVVEMMLGQLDEEFCS